MYLCKYKLIQGIFFHIVYVTTYGHELGHCFSPYKSYSYHMTINKHPTKSVLSRLLFCMKDQPVNHMVAPACTSPPVETPGTIW